MARYIFLKTSVYRPADLVCALSFCFKCRLDLLTVHGASGGIGMNLWRMMNKWGVPPLHLHSLLCTYAKRLADKNRHLTGVFARAHVPRRRIRPRPDHVAIALAAGRTGPPVRRRNAPESRVFRRTGPRGPRADYRAEDERPQAEFICGRSLYA